MAATGAADLPIAAVLPQALAAIEQRSSAVLIAPPGAGKTTGVAPALLGAAWCGGEIIVLSPRRVAARAAAERMAQMLGERAGETVGYQTRLDSKRSAKTRIVVMTEAIFVNRIVADPELPGIAAVLFDEAHERHLDADFALALALETQAVLRPELRLLVMSATLDGARFAALLGGGTPVIESAGKAYPLRLEWLGSSPGVRVEDAMTGAIAKAWRAEAGDILAFLPGLGEIERVRQRLAERLPDALVLPLHGQVDPAGQRRALSRDGDGRRRIVLATSIAETSLTLDGVSVVVDSGLTRQAQFDRAAGTTHLVTVRTSQAAAAQRAGRAARQGPGVCYRMWEEAAYAGRPRFEPPEILTADLAPLLLSLARWGSSDPSALRWLDPPPGAAIAAARNTLTTLGALDDSGRMTPFGTQLAELPLEPALAALVLLGARAGAGRGAAELALLLQERGLGGQSEDLALRLDRWRGERAPRAEASRQLARRWADKAAALVAADEPAHSGAPLAVLLAMARPDFLARRRDAAGENWLSAGGRGYRLDPASPLARADWLAIGDAQGSAKGARITAALALSEAEVEQWLADRIEQRSIARWAGSRVESRLERRLGAITLASGPDPAPDRAAVAELLLARAKEDLARLIPATLIDRARFAGVGELTLDQLAARAEEWLAPLLVGRNDFALAPGAVAEAALGLLTWNQRQLLDSAAPREFLSPAGTRHAIDYAGPDAPSVEVRVQALFGLDTHPLIGRTPLLLKLTSPAGRPLQATRDLPGFWRGSWRDVAREMKGRYPRHRWPDAPWAEAPSLKTKNAFSRGDS
ncbi:MAG: ATP-dependent helicase HrpB [Citromicrobium sp.]|nr:MAG: ATP-dependent helicase HrpB [Citromicrobium sp.]